MLRRSLVWSTLAFVATQSCQRAPEPERAQGAQSAVSARLGSEAVAALDAPSREAVSRAPLPVLLFADGAQARASRVTAGPAWYAISARVGERTFSLHVVRDESAGVAPEGHNERVRGAPAMVLFNEGVRSVTWSERGATYALEVECYHPFEDTACTQSAYVKALAESLVAVSTGETQGSSSSATGQTTAGGAR